LLLQVTVKGLDPTRKVGSELVMLCVERFNTVKPWDWRWNKT
jgi:hypothetical protein